MNSDSGPVDDDSIRPDASGETPEKQETQAPPKGNGVASGTVWNVLGQITPMVITIFLTPYILHGLGVARYGLFVLTASLSAFIATFDGGIKDTAQRYFSLFAGSGDTRRATQLLRTLLLVIGAFGVVASTVGWFVAPYLIQLFSVPHRYAGQATFLLKMLGLLVTFDFIHNLFVGLLQAHSRFSYITKAAFGIYIIWWGGLVCTVAFNWGLRGIAWVFISQAVFLTGSIMPASLKYVDRHHKGLLPRSEIKEFLSFAARTQVSNLSVLINTEFDVLIIGAGLSVRQVSYYNVGQSFGQNFSQLAEVALSPIETNLTNAYGRDGEQGAHEQLRRLQWAWTIGLSGVFSAAMAAAYFGIIAWVGKSFATGGFVAIVALGLHWVFMTHGVLRKWCGAVGRPGIESRFGIVSVVINVVCTIPMLLLGPIGVVGGTAIGQVVGAVYMVRRANRNLNIRPPNPFKTVPLLPSLISAAIIVAIEWVMRPIVPGGGLGLVVCGLPAIVGIAAYLVVVLGPRRTKRIVATILHTRSVGGIKDTLQEVLEEAVPPATAAT